MYVPRAIAPADNQAVQQLAQAAIHDGTQAEKVGIHAHHELRVIPQAIVPHDHVMEVVAIHAGQDTANHVVQPAINAAQRAVLIISI